MDQDTWLSTARGAVSILPPVFTPVHSSVTRFLCPLSWFRYYCNRVQENSPQLLQSSKINIHNSCSIKTFAQISVSTENVTLVSDVQMQSFSEFMFWRSIICLFSVYYCLLCLMESGYKVKPCCPLLFSYECTSVSVYRLVLTLTEESHQLQSIEMLHHRFILCRMGAEVQSPRGYSQQIFYFSKKTAEASSQPLEIVSHFLHSESRRPLSQTGSSGCGQ